jgi:hypothetical protein
VSRRSRLLTFGTAAALVLAGALCAILIPGLLGQALTTVLISLGLAGAVLLVFFEVGLSEDRDLARDQAKRERDARRAQPDRALHRRRLIRIRRRPH